jgi:copper/silver efflux system protein
MLNKLIKYFLEHKLVTILLLIITMVWGLITAPFDWDIDFLPSDSVAVDAIPDIGENQQIVFTQWMGRSPQDIEDQITYPLTTSLLGIPGVKSIRSSSVFGFSTIYIIFDEEVEFYWSRSRILEKLNSLPSGLLPENTQPTIGPDATALGQVYWYTLEGRDSSGNPTGGWDLHEIRTVQDFYVKYGLNAIEGVSEVASIGGYVQEYQIDVMPDALNHYNIGLKEVLAAVRKSNRDVGAKTIEINQVEYLIRGLGYIKSIEDIEKAVVSVIDNVPLRVKDVAHVSLGPATRRGVLDKEGAEVVGGVVVARYGSNPREVINKIKLKTEELSSGLPKKILADGSESQLTIVPFYDRTKLINETLGTLEEALALELLITILVVIVMMLNLRASLLVSSILPISVLMVFVAMRYFNVDANIVALSGIAIAIGTMIDLAIVLTENIIKHQKVAPLGAKLKDTIFKASSEVSGAILTAVMTTIVSFIPVFTMQAAEGKLFKPLAFTKTFALIGALLVALFILPSLAQFVLKKSRHKNNWKKLLPLFVFVLGIVLLFTMPPWSGITLLAFGAAGILNLQFGSRYPLLKHVPLWISGISVTWLLAEKWLPLGANRSILVNFFFVLVLVGTILLFFYLIEKYYHKILSLCLVYKKVFLAIPGFIMLWAVIIWFGFSSVFGIVSVGFNKLNVDLKSTWLWSSFDDKFPGIGEEFMPSLDEGSFLLMPSSMPHAGVTQNKRVVQQLDMLLSNIPEVDLAVGKMGRVESALDPAPISMYENIINYKPEYMVNAKGHRMRYKVDDDGAFLLANGKSISQNEAVYQDIKPKDLVEDKYGDFFRNWRPTIKSPDDIWEEILRVSQIPGVTSAPKLQPIETRLVMLQTGMRAPMGIKVFGPDLYTIEKFGMKLESILKKVPSVKAEAVFAERIVGKPYLHLNIDRDVIALHGLTVEDVQNTIEIAIGGVQVSNTVEGRQRYAIRLRYPRELRDDPHKLESIFVSTPAGNKVPLSDLVTIEYVQGPQMIKSENTFLMGYVLFDKLDGNAEVDVVHAAQEMIDAEIENGNLDVPKGISFKFSGSYENQVRAEKRLTLILPLVLAIIFLILYFQFKSVSTSLMIFTGVAMAFSGAFVVLWLYGQGWFLDFDIFGTNIRELFQMRTVNLSVAVWVGFIALFGIATDDGVLMGTYLDQSFKSKKTSSIGEIHEAVVAAGKKRIKPAVMTSATTVIALLPILTSTGRGADIMIPMAIPAFGGMVFACITYFIVPVLYSMKKERQLNKTENHE